jgi:aminopeptidase S
VIGTDAVMVHLQKLMDFAKGSNNTRTIGSTGFTSTVSYIKQQMDGLGWQTTVQNFQAGGRAAANVIAEWPYGDANHVVMAGAHSDSVQAGPGINDDGSGVAALLENAGAVARAQLRPQQRIRFGFWGAEEQGEVGSNYYVSHLPTGAAGKISAYLNFDMVGSPNAVPELYGDGDPGLGRVLRQAAGKTELGEAEVGGASDHAAFEAAGVPVNGLYTGSTERGAGGRPRDACYHLACDTQGRVSRPALLRMARAAAIALKRLSGQAK